MKWRYTDNTGRRCDFRYFIHQLGHIVSCSLCLRGNYGLNIWQQTIRPQNAEKVWWYWQAGECQEVAEELSRSPVTHLLMHQELAYVLLLFGEWKTCNPFCFNSVIIASGWGVGYYILYLRHILLVQLWDDVVKLCCILCDVRQSKLTLELCEPHSWLFGPEKWDTNTEAVDSESRIRRLLQPCWWISILLHDAFAGSPMWWYRYELSHTHNTHPHKQLYVHATLLLHVCTMSATDRLLAAALKLRHTLTPLFSSHTHDSVSVFIRLWCRGGKISWLHGWAGQWCPPQGHCSSGILCCVDW